ncbi:RNA recognition motif-containing protein [Besnoitia besnoiti]|uniref:RNA recognition motif-containing protein n=1 Tax=Besnoitia besnoiti TaxID=94643 RepID=A0A2A9MBV9_BESBE|nr:RNA recognition motif-containing protein [Besnoitia besnoiti]PFH33406.1 RNA recognition motif-containing protein [Besnoitia besnoiti]
MADPKTRSSTSSRGRGAPRGSRGGGRGAGSSSRGRSSVSGARRFPPSGSAARGLSPSTSLSRGHARGGRGSFVRGGRGAFASRGKSLTSQRGPSMNATVSSHSRFEGGRGRGGRGRARVGSLSQRGERGRGYSQAGRVCFRSASSSAGAEVLKKRKTRETSEEEGDGERRAERENAEIQHECAEESVFKKGSILALLRGEAQETGGEPGSAAASLFEGTTKDEQSKDSKKKRRRQDQANGTAEVSAVDEETGGATEEEERKNEKKSKKRKADREKETAEGSSSSSPGHENDVGLTRLTALFSSSPEALAALSLQRPSSHARRAKEAERDEALASDEDPLSPASLLAAANAGTQEKKTGDSLMGAIEKARAVTAQYRREQKKARKQLKEAEKSVKEAKLQKKTADEKSKVSKERVQSEVADAESEPEEEGALEDEARSEEAEEGWRETDKEKEKRTVFIGNLPLSGWKPPELYRHLGVAKKDVESIRLRSIPVLPKFNKRRLGGLVHRQFTDVKDFQNAYVVLKDRELVRSVLQRDGASFQERPLRVDEAGERGQNVFSRFDRKKTVFVGNLPSRCSEEDLRAALAGNGAIKAVRIIRDKVTSETKGFGFVCFEDRVSVARAVLASNGVTKLQGRVLRVTRALDEATSKMEDAKRLHEKEKKRARRGGASRGVSPAVRRIMQKKQRKMAKRYENRGYAPQGKGLSAAF